MASNVPLVKQVAWISLIPHLFVFGLFTILFYLCGASDIRVDCLLGLGLYWMIVLVLRITTANDHRKGMRLLKKEAFTEAIQHFEASYSHFTEHAWVDEYRYLTMLSSSKMCYREMALCNIAFCYGQTGEGAEAVEYYNRVLKEYPNNGPAQAALRMRDSIAKTFEKKA